MIYVNAQGEKVPALGLGTWELRGAACREAVADALAIGYRHLDTAQAYGNEEQVGRALRESGVDREDVFLTTKVWRDQLEPPAVRRSAEQSLRRLGTDYVDLLLIHWPNEEVPLEHTLDAFVALQQAGRTRHIGVSNFSPMLLERALAHAHVFCNQVEYHPFLGQDPLVEMAREHDLMLTAYCPIARGKVLEDEVLQEIGDAHGKSPAQVALRWLVQQEHVAAIPKAASAEHRRSNLDLFGFALSDEEVARIDGLARGQRLVEPDWEIEW